MASRLLANTALTSDGRVAKLLRTNDPRQEDDYAATQNLRHESYLSLDVSFGNTKKFVPQDHVHRFILSRNARAVLKEPNSILDSPVV